MKRILILALGCFLASCTEKTDSSTADKDEKLTTSTTVESPNIKPETVEGLITSSTIDKAFVGMDINDLKRLYENYQFQDTPVYYFEIDGEETDLVIAKDNKPFMFVWSKDDKVAGLYAISSSLRTKSNLRPGMTIKEILKMYPEAKMSQDIVTGNTECIYIPQEEVSLCFFTSQNTIGIYRNLDEVEPVTNEFKSDTFRVQYIKAMK